MRNPGGYRTITEHDGRMSAENDTFTCCHCNGIVIVAHKASPSDMGGWCSCCGKPTCNAPKCNVVGGCTVFEKWLDETESVKNQRLQKQLGEEAFARHQEYLKSDEGKRLKEFEERLKQMKTEQRVIIYGGR